MQDPKPTLGRRTLIGGAATTAAAAAAAVVLLPSSPQQSPVVAQARPDGEAAPDGYRVTEHVAHYYATARI